MNDAANRRPLEAAAAAYARRFGRVPPSDRGALDDELWRDAPELVSAVTEALHSFSIDELVAEVRKSLVSPVGNAG